MKYKNNFKGFMKWVGDNPITILTMVLVAVAAIAFSQVAGILYENGTITLYEKLQLCFTAFFGGLIYLRLQAIELSINNEFESD